MGEILRAVSFNRPGGVLIGYAHPAVPVCLHEPGSAGTLLRYKPGAKKSGQSATRLLAYRNARSVCEFFGLHPGTARAAGIDLAWDLSEGLCSTPGFATPRSLRSVRLGPVGKAHAAMCVLRTASAVCPLAL